MWKNIFEILSDVFGFSSFYSNMFLNYLTLFFIDIFKFCCDRKTEPKGVNIFLHHNVELDIQLINNK